MDKRKAHSWTRIQHFETCAFMYKMMHLEGKITEIDPLMIVGRVVHNGVNLYNRHCIAKNLEHDYKQWKDCAYQALEQEQLPSENYPEVLEQIKAYADSHEIDLDSVVGAEEEIAINREFKETGWNDPDVWFRGVIDYLQIQGDIAKITDYKTGWKTTAPILQLKIYAWLIWKIYPQISMFEVEMDFTRYGYRPDPMIIEVEDMPEIEREILGKINMIEKEEKFKPRICNACTYCGCWRWCPAMKKEDIIYERPKALPDAVKLATEVEKHSKLASEAKKILKLYCDQKGAVVAADKRYSFNSSISWRIDRIEELITRGDEIGIDVFELLTPKNKDLNYRMDNNPQFKKIVEELGKKVVSVKFGAKKHEPEKTQTKK